MDQEKFQVSRARVLPSIFDELENGPSEVPPGRTKTYDKKYVPDAPKLFVLQENKDACVFSSLSY